MSRNDCFPIDVKSARKALEVGTGSLKQRDGKPQTEGEVWFTAIQHASEVVSCYVVSLRILFTLSAKQQISCLERCTKRA